MGWRWLGLEMYEFAVEDRSRPGGDARQKRHSDITAVRLRRKLIEKCRDGHHRQKQLFVRQV